MRLRRLSTWGFIDILLSLIGLFLVVLDMHCHGREETAGWVIIVVATLAVGIYDAMWPVVSRRFTLEGFLFLAALSLLPIFIFTTPGNAWAEGVLLMIAAAALSYLTGAILTWLIRRVVAIAGTASETRFLSRFRENHPRLPQSSGEMAGERTLPVMASLSSLVTQN
jgi:hypothetical protein